MGKWHEKSKSMLDETSMSQDNPKQSLNPQAPEWFKKAIETPRQQHTCAVEGVNIHYQTWGDPGKPGLLFVHGGSAHSNWWDFIAPFFTDHYVAAICLSGMGDSDYRDHYSPDIYATEIISVCKDAGFPEPYTLVGHSFGGFMCMAAARLYPKLVTRVVMVDSPLRPNNMEASSDPNHNPVRTKKYYDQFEASQERFRLIPDQPCDNAYIVDYIASHSVREFDDGWSWKFDDQLFAKMPQRKKFRSLEDIQCDYCIIYGEKSALFGEEIQEYVKGLAAGRASVVGIPEAHHHVMLDQPIAFVSALRMQLANWEIKEKV